METFKVIAYSNWESPREYFTTCYSEALALQVELRNLQYIVEIEVVK